MSRKAGSMSAGSAAIRSASSEAGVGPQMVSGRPTRAAGNRPTASGLSASSARTEIDPALPPEGGVTG